MDKNFLYWLAGFFDGEGSFTISVGKTKHNKNRSIYLNYSFATSITLRIEDKFLLDKIKKTLTIGKVYIRKNDNSAVWQTTNIEETLYFSKLIFPYLLLKQKSCDILIVAIQEWSKNKKRLFSSYRRKGQKTRTQKEMLRILFLSQAINTGRTKRGKRTEKQYKELETFITENYPTKI